LGGTPARDKSPNLQHSHPAFERDGNHVAGSYHAAGRINARAIHPHMTADRERRRGAARTHQASMPQPFVDALAIKLSRRLYPLVEHDLFEKPAATFPNYALAALLGIGLELRLERR
jgi:hypothetical protein